MTSGQQLLALINDILDLAKIEAGKMRVHPEDVQPRRRLRAGGGACSGRWPRRRTSTCKIIADASGPPVRQDAGKLQQILSNLLSNAIKFTPEGGRVTLKAAADGNDLVLTVTDTGVGIAPEEQELIFEKFRQAANPLTREQGGTGLGLSIVRELAKLLGGDVTLHSELGRGSTFTVRVAAQLADEPLRRFELSDDVNGAMFAAAAGGPFDRTRASLTVPIQTPAGGHAGVADNDRGPLPDTPTCDQPIFHVGIGRHESLDRLSGVASEEQHRALHRIGQLRRQGPVRREREQLRARETCSDR